MPFPAIAALAAGAEVTAAVVLSAVTEVGIAMTVVGAVTGSKDLMKIGGVMSLVGGVGGFINGAVGGAAGAAEGLASPGIDAASTAADYANSADLASDAMTAGQSAAANDTAGLADAWGGQPASSGGIVGGPSATMTTPTDEIGQALQSPAQNAQQAVTTAPDANTVADNTQVADRTAVKTPDTTMDDIDVGGGWSPATGGARNAAPQNASSFWDSFSTFAKGNDKLLASGIQLLGGMASGANQKDMWNQKMALEQQRINQVGFGNTSASYGPRPGIVGGAA